MRLIERKKRRLAQNWTAEDARANYETALYEIRHRQDIDVQQQTKFHMKHRRSVMQKLRWQKWREERDKAWAEFKQRSDARAKKRGR